MSKIFVWGTGVAATNIFNEYFDCNSVYGYIDNNCKKDSFLGRPIYNPEILMIEEWDLLVIASNSAQEIYSQCKEMELDLSKVYFVYRSFGDLVRLNEFSDDTAREVLGEDWVNTLKYEYKIITRNPYIFREITHNEEIETLWGKKRDFVRYETVELISREIRKKNLEGDVAEFGVFKGEFSAFLTKLFPEKNIYLFDTFESFDKEEFENESSQGNCSKEFIEGFKETSEAEVKNKLKNPEKGIVVKGYFPESVKNRKDLDNIKISLCSLDFDFEQGIYDALSWIWPKMEQNGYILIHDYNSYLKGVEKGVQRFERDNNMVIPKVPLCDEYGTLVIYKAR